MAGKLLIVVTGTPGAGKSSFAKELIGALDGAKLIEINDIVEEYKLFSSIDKMGSRIVKLKELEAKLKDVIKNQRKNSDIILVGHLASEMELKPDIAIVVRVTLNELIKRLEARKYQKEKIKENIISESVDYCGMKAREQCKEAYEIETDDAERKEIIQYVVKRSEGKMPKPPEANEINRFKELLDLIADGNKYSL